MRRNATRLLDIVGFGSVARDEQVTGGESLDADAVSMDTIPQPPNTGDDDFFFDLQYGHTFERAQEAWAAGSRDAGVRVFVLDGGFDLDHPDLAPNYNLALSTTFVPGSTDPANAALEQASYTNSGPEIDFSAPGGDFVSPGNESCVVAGLQRRCRVFDLVFSTGNGGWYRSAGTSMAAPHAAGIAAIIIGENGGDMNPAQVRREMRQRAEDLGTRGVDEVHGFGLARSGY